MNDMGEEKYEEVASVDQEQEMGPDMDQADEEKMTTEISPDVQRETLLSAVSQFRQEYEKAKSNLHQFMRQMIQSGGLRGDDWYDKLDSSHKSQWARLSKAVYEAEHELKTAGAALAGFVVDESNEHQGDSALASSPLDVPSPLSSPPAEPKPLKAPDNLPKWYEKENRHQAFDFIELFEYSMTGACIPLSYWPNQLLNAVQYLDHKRWVSANIVNKMRVDGSFTWDDAKRVFMDYFTSSDQRNVLRNQYSQCHQGERESAQDYGARFDQLRSRLGLSAEQQAVTMHFIDRLRASTKIGFQSELERLALADQSRSFEVEVHGSLKRCMELANAVERMKNVAQLSSSSAGSGAMDFHGAGTKTARLKHKRGMPQDRPAGSTLSATLMKQARDMECKPCAHRVRETGRFIRPHAAKDCRFGQSREYPSAAAAAVTNPARPAGLNKPVRVVTCWKCGKQGHYASDCPTSKKHNDGNKGGAQGSSRPPSAMTSNGERTAKKVAVESNSVSSATTEDLLEEELPLEGGYDSNQSSSHSSETKSDMISVDGCDSRNESDSSHDQMPSSGADGRSFDEVNTVLHESGWCWVDRSLPEQVFTGGDEESDELFADPMVDAISARIAWVRQTTIHCTEVNGIEKKHVATQIRIEDKLFLAHLDSQASHSFVDVETVAINKWQTLPANGEIVFADSSLRQPRLGTTIPLMVQFPRLPRQGTFRHAFEILRLNAKNHGCEILVGRDLLDQHFLDVEKKALLLPFTRCSDVAGENGMELQCNSMVVESDSEGAVSQGHAEVTNTMLAKKPDQAAVTTPIALEAEYKQHRERILQWEPLRGALEENERITGFCNIPESVLKLTLKSNAKLRKQYQYPLANESVRLAQPTFVRFRDGGRIERAPPGCPYNNPIVLPAKKNDEGKYVDVRFCGDFRHVNSNLAYDDAHAIPDIRRAIADTFADCIIFGQFDLKDAYLQLLLHPDSRNLCAFMWKEPQAQVATQWRFVGCPFGLAPLTGHFQRFMSNAFSDLPFAFPYLDNMVFGSKSWEEHAQHALIIVQRLNSMNLKIKHSTIMLGHANMRALGHVVGFGGVSIDPDKLAAVAAWEKPRTGKDMQRFLGFIGFIAVHIRHFADLTARMQAVKSDDAKIPIEWSAEMDHDFSTLKQAIMRAPTLAYPNTSKRFCIATDASNVGIGGVLYQPEDADYTITPTNIITFTSHKLNDTQRRYPAYKKELFAIVTCLRKFHTYIALRTDTVVLVDHKPLTYLMTATALSTSLQQWLDVIQDCQFTPVYRPGILHVLPDALSRMYAKAYVHAPAWGIAQASTFTELVGVPPAGLHQDIPFQDRHIPVKLTTRRGTSWQGAATPSLKGGGMLSKVEEQMLGQSSSSTDTPSAAAHNIAAIAAAAPPANAASRAEQLQERLLTDWMSEVKGKAIPQAEKRRSLVSEAHQLGHFGRDAIYQKLFHDGFWWPKMRADIEAEVKACDACVRFVVGKQGFHPMRPILSSVPWDHIQVDTSTNLPPSVDGCTVLLVIIDVFTGFVLLRALRKKEATTVAKELLSIFCLFGFPRIIQSDNGTEFVNQVVSCLLAINGVKHRIIAAYNPRADGKVERAVGSTLLIIKKLLHGHQEAWSLYVDFAQLSFNLKIASLTNSSPFVLMFGRRANELKDFTADPPMRSIDLDAWKEHQDKLTALVFPAVSERIKAEKQKMVKKFERIRKAVMADPLPAGARVMLRDMNRQNKFEPSYVGPYTVEKKMRSGSYLLRDAVGDLLDRIVPIDQLKVISRQPGPEDADENIFQVRRIVDHRSREGAQEYLVDWVGYEERTWEPEQHILDSGAVSEYWKRLKERGSSSISSSMKAVQPTRPSHKRAKRV